MEKTIEEEGRARRGDMEPGTPKIDTNEPTPLSVVTHGIGHDLMKRGVFSHPGAPRPGTGWVETDYSGVK